MNNIKYILLLVAIYFFGSYSGISLQTASAIVKAPEEKTQPVENTTASTENTAPTENAVKQNPHRNPNPAPIINSPPKKIIQEPVKKVESKPVTKNTKAQKGKKWQKAAKVQAQRTPKKAAATDKGATLFSLTSSILVDIKRMEEDLAALKAKVNTLNNIR